MDISLGTGMAIIGIAILVLLVVLSALAGLIYFITGVIKDNVETEEETTAAPPAAGVAVEPVVVDERSVKTNVALIAVALARAAQVGSGRGEEGESGNSSWRQYYQTRRLNQTLNVRRSS
jgi:Na+-transporting methylmalonyl-CoA/oxaloacetate decarboxylase gamma subunit